MLPMHMPPVRVPLNPYDPKLVEWRRTRDFPSPSLKSARHMSAGNAVKVNHGDNIWYLGYIHDMQDDYMFVDFRSRTKPAAWIPVQNVWPHDVHWIHFPLMDISASTSIQVAVRENQCAPFIFQPTSLVLDSVYDSSYLTVVNLQGHNRIVHRCRITEMDEMLPEKSVLGRRGARTGEYVKHIVPFPPAYAVTHIDEHRAQREIVRAVQYYASAAAVYDDSLSPGYDFFKFYFAFATDYVMFIAWERCWTYWTTEHLANAFLECRANGTINCQVSIAVPMLITTHVSGEFDTLADTVGLKFVIPELLSDILMGLDSLQQYAFRRVCKKWKYVLTTIRFSHHITIDFRTVRSCPKMADQSYEFCTLLDRICTAKLKTLVMFNWELDTFRVNILQNYVKLRNFNLILLMLKDCVVLDEIVPLYRNWGKLNHLQSLAALCRWLHIRNYSLLDDPICNNALVARTLQLRPHASPRWSGTVTIPRFRFDGEKPEPEQFNQFFAAVSNVLSDVSEADERAIVNQERADV